MDHVKPSYMHCSLCGFEFEKNAMSCAGGCPVSRYCKLVRCPNCGYEFPEPPRALTWLEKLFGRRKTPATNGALLSLDEVPEGEHCELVCLNGSPASRRGTLAVYGLVPGCKLRLVQRRPSYVIQVGETELAFESNIAREMFVKRLAS